MVNNLPSIVIDADFSFPNQGKGKKQKKSGKKKKEVHYNPEWGVPISRKQVRALEKRGVIIDLKYNPYERIYETLSSIH